MASGQTTGPGPALQEPDMVYRIRGWETLQHYRQRRPPWIKLHRSMTESMDWHELDPQAAKALISLMHQASDHEGYLPGIKEIAWRLRLPERQVELIMGKLYPWVEHVASGVHAERSQHAPEPSASASTEAETKRETNTEERKRQKRVHAPESAVKPADVDDSTWNDFLQVRRVKRAAVTATALDRIRSEASKAGWSLQKALQEICARGWSGFNADWVKDTPSPRLVNRQAAIEAENDRVAREWVAQSRGPDPELERLKQQRADAVPPPAEIRAQMTALRAKAPTARAMQ